MWPFKKKVSALTVVMEIVDEQVDQEEKLISSQLGFEIDKIQILLLRHALLLLTVKFLHVSKLWESAICDSFALHLAEHDPENKSRLGLALYQYPLDESPFDKASFYGNNVCRPIVKCIEFFYTLNSLNPDKLQVLIHAMMHGEFLFANAKLITNIEKSMKVSP